MNSVEEEDRDLVDLIKLFDEMKDESDLMKYFEDDNRVIFGLIVQGNQLQSKSI